MNAVELSFVEYQDANYAIITLNEEGKFNPAMLSSFIQALDDTLANSKTQCLIITGATKNFSQGLDLLAMAGMGKEGADDFLRQCMAAAVERILLFPMPVVAAINGHAFGLGAMMALATDYKIMREDRGFFCLPESTIEINLIPSMNALVTSKLSGNNLRDVLLTGKHIGGQEAEKRTIVDLACKQDELIQKAKDIALPMVGKSRKIISELKMGINQSILPSNFNL